jgi:uncharacterized protein (DUF433 family)
MMSIMQPTKHIDITPGICSGRPRVAGTRIRVENVVSWTEQGLYPDDIVAAYPQLTPADVHAALANYLDHRSEIEGQMREDAEFLDAMRAKRGSHLPPVSAGKDADADSL